MQRPTRKLAHEADGLVQSPRAVERDQGWLYIVTFLVTLIFAFGLAGCGEADDASDLGAASEEPASDSRDGGDEPGTSSGDDSTGGERASDGPGDGDGDGMTTDPSAPPTDDFDGGAAEGGGGGGAVPGGGSTCPDGAEGCVPDDVPAGQLTAGEWRDLDDWSFWRALFDGEDADWTDEESYWSFYTAQRFSVSVTSGDRPSVDVPVTLRDARGEAIWTARTDRHGRAELFAGLFGAEASGPFSVEAGDSATSADDVAPTGDGEPIALSLDDADAPEPALDLMFVIDTTGSMSDELSYIQAELRDVVERVQASAGEQLLVRTSVNFYRDTTDDYIVRDFPFTTELGETLTNLAAQSAGGGGDFPEAVEQGLANGVHDHVWNDEATARLLFLILDAPPHHTDPIIEQLHQTTAEAARLGIRIVPLAASGVDKHTEFLLRFLAVSTGGTYTFLTNHSGIGGEHIEATVGPHEIEFLNDLLVRVINEALGAE